MKKGGSENDIYWWCSQIPDKEAPKNDGYSVRIIRELGFIKIGKSPNLPMSRRRKKGCYMHDNWVSDPQVGGFLMAIGHKFIIDAKAENNVALYDYLARNHVKLAKEIEGKDISEI